MGKTGYQWLPGPVGECLKPASLATTAAVPISPTTTLIYTTTHLGLDLETCELVNDTIEGEFEAIFNCLDAALKNAGAVRGCGDAYRFTSYMTKAEYEPTMQEVFKRRWPGHTPTWATVIVPSINIPSARAEIAAEGAIYHE